MVGAWGRGWAVSLSLIRNPASSGPGAVQLRVHRVATFVICRGLPGSGKTTWAEEWVARDPINRFRANRDDIRRMGHNSVYISRDDGRSTEQAVIAARNAMIIAVLELGVDVVCDDTNLPWETVQTLKGLAKEADAALTVVDFTDVPLEECLRRNALREGNACLDPDIIRRMHARYVDGQPYPLPMSMV